jgi:shikimate kinase / 3-dehydroquinate synthase
VAGAIVLVGFMGAGKTSAARALHPEPLDTDTEIERRTGCTIPELFARDGEAAFRALEERVTLELLDAAPAGTPVALGGGTLGSARVRAALAEHTVAYLEIDEATAWERATADGVTRPLAADRERFAALLDARRPVYEAVADAFLDQRALPAAADALRSLPSGTRMIWYAATHPVFLGAGAWPELRPGDFLVTDEHVAALHGDRVTGIPRHVIAPGEAAKTLATAEEVWTAMAREGVTRAGRVIALGGGVVGDLAGFCAATYQRGIPVVQIPTTLVAQVDSAYGGKTGVDLPHAKNYVGAYHQPQAVHVVPGLLATLPPEERAAGYAEVLKTAIIAGGALWERVAAGGEPDADVILACARTKLAVVAADERDGGVRQTLNLGHTVGHAIETVTGYARYRHGEAVALGLLAALRLSGLPALREQVRALLASHGLPTELDPAIDPADIVAATRADKKRLGAFTPFVLVHAPGDVRPGARVFDADVLGAVAELADGFAVGRQRVGERHAATPGETP